MNERTALTITSLAAGVLAAMHLTDDIVRGFEPGGTSTVTMIAILTTWWYAALVLNGKTLGRVILLLGGLLGAVVPWIHMQGPGMVGGRIANSDGKFLWVFTLLTLGATGAISAILAARALIHGFVDRRRARSRV